MKFIRLCLLIVVSVVFWSTDCFTMELSFLGKSSNSMFRRMQAVFPPDPLRKKHFFTTTPLKLAGCTNFKESRWTYDPVKQLYYSGKNLGALASAQRHRKPIIDDPKADMVVYNSIEKMGRGVKVPAFDIKGVKKKYYP